MSEFKGTKGGWTRYTSSIPSMDNYITHSVYTGTKRIALCYDFFESDKSKNTNDIEAQYNALLISKAPEMLEKLKEILFIVDWSYEAWTSNDGLNIKEEIEQLIKEATTL